MAKLFQNWPEIGQTLLPKHTILDDKEHDKQGSLASETVCKILKYKKNALF